MKNLVIVESPSKAKTIKKYLGKDYEVIASVGHIRDLSTRGKGGLGVDIENGFKPDYVNMKEKAKTIAELKKLSKACDNVYLASDPDREGEAIAWHIADVLGLDLNDKNRIEFHEITKNVVQNALANPRSINMDLVRSQETRRILDRIIGFETSGVLRRKIKSESAGRVQSVALRLICDREHEIENFKAEEYWTIKALLNKDKTEVETELVKDNGKKVKIENETKANEYKSRILAPVELIEIKKDKKNRIAPLPFRTSTLQQEASTKLGMTSKKTMQIAQQLYEGIDVGNGPVGLITYMRTDSTRLSDDFVKSAMNHIESNYGKKYVGKYRATVNENAQDAHEGIRPTSVDYAPETIKDKLSSDQYKLYKFIYARALASLMANAVNDSVQYVFETDNLTLTANGSVLNFDGFLKVYGDYDKSKNVELPELSEHDMMDVKDIKSEQKFTEAPSRFTEASLVKALEEDGVGRPSTYASIIETIKLRKYVEYRNSTETSKTKVFFPTEQGMLTDDKLKEFFKDFINVEYTAEMEKDLDEIAVGSLNNVDILRASYDKFIPLIEYANEHMEKIAPEKTGRKCPECGGDLVFQKSKFGKFVACGNYPKCRYIEKDENEPETTGEKCPECGSDLIYKKGRFGKFIGCSNYPSCRYIKKDEAPELKAGDTCPECGKPLVEKEGRFGKFVACEDYPSCKFTVKAAKKKAVPVGRACPECGKDLVIRGSRKGDFIACSGFPKCRHTEKI